MTVRKWIGIASAVAVGLLVAAGVVWGMSAAADARAPMERCEVDVAARAEQVGADPGDFCQQIRDDQPDWFTEQYGS